MFVEGTNTSSCNATLTPSMQLEIEPRSINADNEAAAAEEGDLSAVGVVAGVVAVASPATPSSDSKSGGEERGNGEDSDGDVVSDVFTSVDDDIACFYADLSSPASSGRAEIFLGLKYPGGRELIGSVPLGFSLSFR
jgi:hypothetical protein